MISRPTAARARRAWPEQGGAAVLARPGDARPVNAFPPRPRDSLPDSRWRARRGGCHAQRAAPAHTGGDVPRGSVRVRLP